MVFTALRRKSEFAAGIWVALGLFKFQLSLPFIAPSRAAPSAGGLRRFLRCRFVANTDFLRHRRFCNLVALPGVCLGLYHNPKFSWLAPIGTPNLRGLVSVLCLPNHPRLGAACLLIISGILLAVATVVCRAVPGADSRHLDLAFSSTLIISVLLSYHILVHDLSVLFLALLLPAWKIRSQEEPRHYGQSISYCGVR